MLALTPSYLALGGGHLCKQSLGHFGPLHLLLDLIVDVGVDVEDGALALAVPLAGQRRRLHLACDTKLVTPAMQILCSLSAMHTYSINIKPNVLQSSLILLKPRNVSWGLLGDVTSAFPAV